MTCVQHAQARDQARAWLAATETRQGRLALLPAERTALRTEAAG